MTRTASRQTSRPFGAKRTCCGFGSASSISVSTSRRKYATASSASVNPSWATTSFWIGAAVACLPSSTPPTLRDTPALAANQPTVSNVGDMSITPLVSIRPCVVRMP
jgi:hypothetical protein